MAAGHGYVFAGTTGGVSLGRRGRHGSSPGLTNSTSSPLLVDGAELCAGTSGGGAFVRW
jgi:hypothetical protein